MELLPGEFENLRATILQGRKTHARFVKNSFPEKRRKSLSKTLRKRGKNHGNGRLRCELHREVCDPTSIDPSVI